MFAAKTYLTSKYPWLNSVKLILVSIFSIALGWEPAGSKALRPPRSSQCGEGTGAQWALAVCSKLRSLSREMYMTGCSKGDTLGCVDLMEPRGLNKQRTVSKEQDWEKSAKALFTAATTP